MTASTTAPNAPQASRRGTPQTADPLTVDLLQALGPILRRINLERELSPGKMGILRHLQRNGRATTAELAAAVHVSPQGISLAARELDRLGLIAKTRDEHDRRKVWIVLTDAGHRAFAKESMAGQTWLDSIITNDLSQTDRRRLEACLPVLRQLGGDAA